jgi:hypothetical protein
MASELIEDEFCQISFLTSIASTTKDLNFKNSVLEDAFIICNSIPYIEHKLTALISIAEIKGSSSRERCIEEIKRNLRLNYPDEVKIQYYWQLCELINEEIDEETYSNILISVKGVFKNFQRLSQVRFNCIKKYIKPTDQLKFFHLASQLEIKLDYKIELLKDIQFEGRDEYIKRYTLEIEATVDSFQKCRLLSLLGEIINDNNLHKKALDIAHNLKTPNDKLQAYLSVDRSISEEYYSQIFEKSAELLCKFKTDKEYKKSLLSVLRLNGRTYEFMNKVIDDYAYSEGYEFKAKVLESISISSKRPDNMDDILIDKLICTVSEVIDIEERSRVFLNLLPIINQQNKHKLLPIILYRKSKASRQETLAFITNNLDFLYELGGEQLLVSFRNSLKEASKWWP